MLIRLDNKYQRMESSSLQYENHTKHVTVLPVIFKNTM